ncbi:MAG: hypothetical protein ACLR5J_02705 [Lachnospiraceae bacterium]
MLSGATLFDYRSRYSTKEFLLRRAKRVLIPFLFQCLMLIWHCSNGTFTIEDYSFSNLLTIILLISTKAYTGFSANLATYLCMPVLSLLKDQNKFYGICFCWISNTFLLSTPFRVIGSAWNTSANFPMTGGYLIFTILGYLLATTDFLKNSALAFMFLPFVLRCFAIWNNLSFQ